MTINNFISDILYRSRHNIELEFVFTDKNGVDHILTPNGEYFNSFELLSVELKENGYDN